MGQFESAAEKKTFDAGSASRSMLSPTDAVKLVGLDDCTRLWPTLAGVGNAIYINQVRGDAASVAGQHGEKPLTIDFSHVDPYGFTPLIAVQAIMQGARNSVQSIAMKQGMSPRYLPLAFSHSLNQQLHQWVRESGNELSRMNWNDDKLRFYYHLQRILHQAFQEGRFNPVSTFTYCLSEQQHQNGFNIFDSFFPHLSAILEQRIDPWVADCRKLKIRDINEVLTELARSRQSNSTMSLRELVQVLLNKRTTGNRGQGQAATSLAEIVSDIEKLASAAGINMTCNYNLAVELAHLRSNQTVRRDDLRQEKERIRSAVGVKQQVQLPTSRVVHEERQHSHERRLAKVLSRPFDQREKSRQTAEINPDNRKFWDPSRYGVPINQKETDMLREFYANADSHVVSPSALRSHPEQFARMQIGIMTGIASEMKSKFNIDINGNIPFPEEYARDKSPKAERQKQAFLHRVQTIRGINRYLVVLLTKYGQDRFLELMPYTTLPPSVYIDNKAIPVTDKEHAAEIAEIIKKTPAQVLNQTPFLHHISLNGIDGDKPKANLQMTIPAEYIRAAQESGAVVLINHGALRYVLVDRAVWPAVSSDDYMPWRKVHDKYLDVDLLFFGGKMSPAKIAQFVAQRLNDRYGLRGADRIVSSLAMGRSMAGIDYGFMWNHKPSKIPDSQILDIGHHTCTINHAFPGWSDYHGGTTSLFLETMTTFTAFRSLSAVPVWLDDKNGNAGLALKCIDPFNALACWREIGNGVLVGPTRRTVIHPISMNGNYPLSSPMSLYKSRRDLDDIVYAEGVPMPAGRTIINRHQDHWNDVRTGAAQLRNRFRELSEHKDVMLRALSDIQLEDLRKEMEKIRRLIIDAPSTMMILLSGNNSDDPTKIANEDNTVMDNERGLAGLGVGWFYPGFSRLIENHKLWSDINDRFKKESPQDGENALHFIARLILTDESGRGRHEIAQAIRAEFMKAPVEIATKLANSLTYEENHDPLSIFWESLDWMVLDPNGIGPLAFNFERWKEFIRWVQTREKADLPPNKLESWKEAYKAYFKNSVSYNILAVNSETLKRRMQEDGLERQIQALMTFLVYPGFGKYTNYTAPTAKSGTSG